MVLKSLKNKEIIDLLKNGGVGVIPTDTIYGIVGSALNKKTVEKIYRLRRRNSKKPFIVLISSSTELKLFGIKVDYKVKKFIRKNWPGKVSVVFSCSSKKFSYLHRGTRTLAFRLPALRPLASLIKKVGPLVAPSANPEGKKPAPNVKEAKKYFKNKVDFYIDGGNLKSAPSTLVAFRRGRVVVLRQGAIRLVESLK